MLHSAAELTSREADIRIAAGVLTIVGGLGAMVGASMAVGVIFVFAGLSMALVALVTILALMVMSFIGAYCTLSKKYFTPAIIGGACAAATVVLLFRGPT